MALFGGSKAPALPGGAPIDPKWARAPSGAFHLLLKLDPDEAGIRGLGGVFVVWHGGIRPQWVFVGESPSLGRAIDAVIDDPEVTQYQTNGGLFVSWANVKEEWRRGVVLYLNRALKPLVHNPRAPTEESEFTKPIAVLVPGGKAPAK